jgi:hypothetical protein
MLIAVLVYRYRNVKQTARLFHVVFVKRDSRPENLIDFLLGTRL